MTVDSQTGLNIFQWLVPDTKSPEMSDEYEPVIDYCRISTCPPKTSVACSNNDEFAKTCVRPSFISLTDSQISRILNLHNGNRSRVASGKLAPFSPAKRMAQLKWNGELAWLAGLNVKKCMMQHDECTNTVSLKNVGQNLASTSTTGSITIEAFIDRSIGLWLAEAKDVTPADIKKMGPQTKLTSLHFTMMMQERSTDVGCAISKYGRGKWNVYLLACNYASTNAFGCSVYRTGSPASGCLKGFDATYPGLCKLSENIDPNQFLCT